MQKEEFKQQFLTFLQSINLDQEVREIDNTTNLLEAGYIDSLNMVEMIIYLEEMTGEEIAIENYQLRNFYTIEGIYHTFIANKVTVGGISDGYHDERF